MTLVCYFFSPYLVVFIWPLLNRKYFCNKAAVISGRTKPRLFKNEVIIALEQFSTLSFFSKNSKWTLNFLSCGSRVDLMDSFWNGVRTWTSCTVCQDWWDDRWFLGQNLLQQENDTGANGLSFGWLWIICWRSGTEMSYSHFESEGSVADSLASRQHNSEPACDHVSSQEMASWYMYLTFMKNQWKHILKALHAKPLDAATSHFPYRCIYRIQSLNKNQA